MNKGIYISLSGAMLKQQHIDIFSQNLANANTSGYKRDRIAFKDYMVPAVEGPGIEGSGRIMTELSKKTTDFSQGPMAETGNPLDVAIQGEGFFVLEGNRYTRNGRFGLDLEGNLITPDGSRVQGDGGPITLDGGTVEISDAGEIFVDQISVGRLQVVRFDDPSVLRKTEGGFFTSDQAGEVIDAQVKQGVVESSNVNVIRELVEMITAQREFEAYQKMIRTFDDAAGKTINEMGK